MKKQTFKQNKLQDKTFHLKSGTVLFGDLNVAPQGICSLGACVPGLCHGLSNGPCHPGTVLHKEDLHMRYLHYNCRGKVLPK